MTTPDPSLFRQLLAEDEATATPQLRSPEWHLEMAEHYSAEAAAQLGAQIDRNGGSASPPHALRFAEMHAQLAIARQAVGGRFAAEEV